ncbi:hypothetical protein V1634_27875 [Plantactinospora veratri]|uniref:MFS transporter n=1 Tax=Plantactinospora veratri TaxID=1436122 RepID=A0ABU7SL18_9ACTN
MAAPLRRPVRPDPGLTGLAEERTAADVSRSASGTGPRILLAVAILGATGNA